MSCLLLVVKLRKVVEFFKIDVIISFLNKIMIIIRLKRVGKKNQPSYRVIVTDKNLGGPKGKVIEYLGWYSPLTKKYSLKKERISYWLSQGAQTSDSIYNLLVKDGIITGKKKAIKIKPSKKAKEEKKTEDLIGAETNQEAAQEIKEDQIESQTEPEVQVESPEDQTQTETETQQQTTIKETVISEEIAKE